MTPHLSIPTENRVMTAEKIIKSFNSATGGECKAVDEVSFTIESGELTAIIGPSGSGKTTLLTMMGCMLKPTSGSINIMGVNISDLQLGVLHLIRGRLIGFIFQGFNLFPHLTVLENILLAYTIKGHKITKNIKEEAVRILSEVQLDHRLNFLPKELSGGQRQRVAIARALVGNPPLILADEPTGNLDPESAELVFELLKNACKQKGHSVVIVTHDIKIAERVNRVIKINNGKIIENKKL